MAKSILVLPQESWKPVVGYEGLYDVSDLGRVKSLRRTKRVVNRWGFEFEMVVPERLLSQATKQRGRKNVCLSKCGVLEHRAVHRMVLEAFVGPCVAGMECCHGNGDASDNRLVNLRWDTHLSNMRDRDLHGRTKAGSRLPEAVQNDVRDLASKATPVRRIARILLLGRTQVRNVVRAM